MGVDNSLFLPNLTLTLYKNLSWRVDQYLNSFCCQIHMEGLCLTVNCKKNLLLKRKIPKFSFDLWVCVNKTWVCSPTHSKANVLTLSCDEGKYSIYCRYEYKETRIAGCSKSLNPPMDFGKAIFFKTFYFVWVCSQLATL